MRKLVYYVGTSIDGYIAGPGNETDFFPLAEDILAWIIEEFPETLPTHVRSQIGVEAPNQCFDTVVMGRGTYQPALDIGVSSPYQHLRQFVVATTLQEITDSSVALISSDPVRVVRELKSEKGMDIWLAGGGVLAGTLLPEIDEIIMKRYPIVAGAGIPAFTRKFQPTAFQLIDTRSFDSGALVTKYRRIASGSSASV